MTSDSNEDWGAVVGPSRVIPILMVVVGAVGLFINLFSLYVLGPCYKRNKALGDAKRCNNNQVHSLTQVSLKKSKHDERRGPRDIIGRIARCTKILT